MSLNNKEFSAKKVELDGLARNVDLWMNTPMSKDKSDKIDYLFEQLQKQLGELDDQYLETKLSFYKQIYEEIKK